jgi:hypothetical protein
VSACGFLKKKSVALGWGRVEKNAVMDVMDKGGKKKSVLLSWPHIPIMAMQRMEPYNSLQGNY